MKTIKLTYKKYFKSINILLIIPFLLLSCNSSDKKEIKNNSTPKQAIIQVQEKTPEFKFEIVENEKVCMVNDRYMVVKQIPIDVNGIMYWGCCEMCVKKLQENIEGVRFAKEPNTGKEVDKANAIIVQNKEDGAVFYFESKASAEKFIATNG